MNFEGTMALNTSNENRFQYNGKELEKDGGINLSDYGARWYDAAIGRFTGVDRFTEKYSFQSPYAYSVNDPIRFIDVNGDSIGVNLISDASQEAFAAFFATKEGRAFVGQFSAKGQTVNGHTFKSDGKYHRKGIDLVYNEEDMGERKTATGATTAAEIKGGRLKLDVSINTTASRKSLIEKVTAITHESFLHVQEDAFDYSDDGKLNYSHDSFYRKLRNKVPSARHHTMFHYKPNASTTHPFATKGMSVLEHVNSRKRLGYSRTQLWNKLWTFWD